MEEKTIELQLDEATAQGTYANIAIVSNNENEVILDFAFIQPSQPTSKVSNRIIMHPRQAKRLAVTLSNAIVQYEKQHGILKLQNNES